MIIVLSAPSGGGKSSIINAIIGKNNDFIKNISYTTRKARDDKDDLANYHFITIAEFESMIKNGDMIEYSKVFGNYYGTSKHSIELNLKKNKDIFLDLDNMGFLKIKNFFTNNLISIFIIPPTFKELRARLCKRSLDSEEAINLRMKEASKKIIAYSEYDYLVINDDLNKSISLITQIILSEKLKIANIQHLPQIIHESYKLLNE